MAHAGGRRKQACFFMPPAVRDGASRGILRCLDDNARHKLSHAQAALESLYGLEPGPAVADFVRWVDDTSWESLRVQQVGETVELELLLPESVKRAPAAPSDTYLQLVEGVSHFVLMAERARTELPITLLELELQAEVDKFALLAPLLTVQDATSLRQLHHWLFERVTFLHEHATEQGQRYRKANALAARLWARLVRSEDAAETQCVLRQFYRAGQSDKIRLAEAA